MLCSLAMFDKHAMLKKIYGRKAIAYKLLLKIMNRKRISFQLINTVVSVRIIHKSVTQERFR